MALRCISRYRATSGGRVYHIEPGEVLTGLPADEEAWLLRDSPGSFEWYDPTAAAAAEVAAPKALDAPPAHRMVEREHAARKESERGPGAGAMSSADQPGLIRLHVAGRSRR